jgi:hypothetical protein
VFASATFRPALTRHAASFWWAAPAAIIVSAVNGIPHVFFGNPREQLTRIPGY